MWQQLFVWSKKIHRWVMWAVIILGGYMMFSGFLLYWSLEGLEIPLWLDMHFLRKWHRDLSQWFLVALLTQMLTGVTMWLSPKMLKRAQGNRVIG